MLNPPLFLSLQVQYLNTEGLLIQNLTLGDSITISELKPHRNYTFTVVVRSGTESSVLRRSLPVSAIFQTHESVPGKVIVRLLTVFLLNYFLI